MVVVSNKQIKIFNKLYSEFLADYIKVSGKPNATYKIKNSITLETYKKDIDISLDDFLSCKTSCLNNISLLKDSGVTWDKVKINWKILHNLYFLVDKTKDQKILDKSKESIAVDLIGKNDFLSDLVGDLSGDIQKSLEGKDLSKLNPALLMNSLLAGDRSVGGIDFADIIAKTTEKLRAKVENGEINIDQLKGISGNIKSVLE